MKRCKLLLLTFSLSMSLAACGGTSAPETLPPSSERPTNVEPVTLASFEPREALELERTPTPLREFCVDRMEEGAFDTPICDALAPLRVVFNGELPIEVAPGGTVELALGLLETSGVGMFRYPGVAAFSHHPAANIEGTVQLFGIFGCQAVATPMVLSIDPSVPSGTEIVVEVEVMALEGSCEQAHRLELPVRVL